MLCVSAIYFKINSKHLISHFDSSKFCHFINMLYYSALSKIYCMIFRITSFPAQSLIYSHKHNTSHSATYISYRKYSLLSIKKLSWVKIGTKIRNIICRQIRGVVEGAQEGWAPLVKISFQSWRTEPPFGISAHLWDFSTERYNVTWQNKFSAIN